MAIGTVTKLLLEWNGGNDGALNALMPLVYDELRRMAKSYIRRERPGNTLATTGLLHEAYLRLLGQRVRWESRTHFFGVAARMMRNILVDRARSQERAKRGGRPEKVPLDACALASQPQEVKLLALDEALTRLEKLDPQRSRIVEIRFFGGLSNQEASEVLDISTATVQRQWAGARAWLHHELRA